MAETDAGTAREAGSMNASLQKSSSTAETAPFQGTADLVAPFAKDDFDRDVWSVLGLPIDLLTAPEAVQAIEIAARDRRPLSFVTPNVNFLVRALKDAETRRQIVDTDLSLIDGAPLVAIGRLVGAPIRERCAGSDVFDALRLRAGFAGRRLRVFFFGGRDGAAAAASAAIDAEKRGVQSAGYLNPGCGDLDSMSRDEIIDEINGAGADFVLVSLGAAKGQAWIDRNRSRIEAPVVAHLGAVVDFVAGSISRAPSLVRRVGLEWAWRIKEDPSLWRRYWNDGLSLVSIVLRNLAPAIAAARGRGDGVGSEVVLSRTSGATFIALSGDLVASGREPLRKAFRAASASGVDVVLDLKGAGRIDASFLGLVLMLEKNLRANGGVIRLANVSRAHRRLFLANAMAYGDANPLQAGDERRAIAAAV